MNSRQRVLKAVNFEKPDRVPIDLGAVRPSGMNAVIYDKLKKCMGINTPTKIMHTMQMLAQIEPEVLDKLHVDVVPLDVNSAAWAQMDARRGLQRKLFCGLDIYFSPQTKIKEQPDGNWGLLNASGDVFGRMPKNGFYFDLTRPTMAGKKIDPKLFKPCDTVGDEELEVLAKRAKNLYENTDKAIIGWGANINLIGLSSLSADNITQGSLDEWLCMLMLEKETANEMMSRYVDAVIKCLKLYHQAVGDYCFAWGVAGDDAGTQRSEVMSPELFAEMVKPHYKRLCDWVHTHTNWKTFLHSCGSIYNFIPYWIEAGIDILNPVQISAANMEPEKLMKDFGGKIVFWGGGCDTQKVLPLGSPEQIKQHVKHNISVFASGSGGYIFNQVHNIQQNVPVKNVEVMFETAYEYCRKVCQ